MDDLVRFALLDAAALALTALYLAAVRLLLGDRHKAITPAGVGTMSILTFAALLGAPLTAIAHSAGIGIALSLSSGLILVFGAIAVLDTILPNAFRAMQSLGFIFLFPILATIVALPFGLFMRLVF